MSIKVKNEQIVSFKNCKVSSWCANCCPLMLVTEEPVQQSSTQSNGRSLPHFELHMASTLVSYVNISLIQRDRDISVCLSTAEPDCVDFLTLPTWACLSVSADPYKQHGWILCWSLVAVSYSCIGAERNVSLEVGMGGHSSLSALPALSACGLKKEKLVLFRECF